jgi:hypothetical protein
MKKAEEILKTRVACGESKSKATTHLLDQKRIEAGVAQVQSTDGIERGSREQQDGKRPLT